MHTSMTNDCGFYLNCSDIKPTNDWLATSKIVIKVSLRHDSYSFFINDWFNNIYILWHDSFMWNGYVNHSYQYFAVDISYNGKKFNFSATSLFRCFYLNFVQNHNDTYCNYRKWNKGIVLLMCAYFIYFLCHFYLAVQNIK